MKKLIILITISFVCIPLALSQKDKSSAPITFMVFAEDDYDELEGVTAKLFEKGNLVETQVTKADGSAMFKMQANSEYSIEISKQKYVSKKISIITKIPDYEKQQFVINLPILLFKPCAKLDYSVLNDPVAKVQYDDLRRDFFPEKSYEKVMISKLQQLMKNNEDCKEDEYQDIVKKGDREFTEKKYEDSRSTYVKAQQIRPENEHVIAQIAEIDRILAEKKNKEKAYDNYITQADKQFSAKNYTLAREFYKRALTSRPGAEYPTSQIAAIEKLLARKDLENKDKQAQEAAFQQVLDQGDQAMLNNDCGKALKAYHDAIAMRPNDQELLKKTSDVEKKCQDIQAKQSQEKAIQDKYNAAISKADDLMKKGSLDDARKSYQQAVAIKPAEDYPQSKIDEIDRTLRQQAKDSESAYKVIKDAGDNAFDLKKYSQAKENYQNALELKPNDPYCQAQLKQLDKLIADKAVKDAKDKERIDNYNKAIADADKLLAANDYANAKTIYQKAAQMMPENEYPEQKIKEIDKTLKAKEKAADNQFSQLISDADKAFDSENLNEAKDLYNKALSIKSGDTYSKDKIKTIESILAEQQRIEAEKRTKQTQYDRVIADADALMKKPDYEGAKTAYQKALQILSSEVYPKQKLNEIDNLIKEQADKQDKDFNTKVRNGDRNYAQKNYAQAIQDYKDALKIKPSEQYASQRIEELNKLIADQQKLEADRKAKQDAYNAAIAKADNLLKNQQYDQAVLVYKEALSYKPDEQTPFNKIDEISKIKKEKEKEANYKKTISSGDNYFGQKQYEQSKSYYAKALELKPNDKYASDQIAKIDKAISDQLKQLADAKARQDAYDKAVADAEKNLTLKNYNDAKASFQTAMAIFPDKPYPKQKVAAIDNILMEQKNDEDYRSILNEANDLYSSKNYEQAKARYEQAAILKPQDAFTGQKIAEIDNIIAKQEAEKQKQNENEKSYNASILRANDLFDKAQYDAAKKEYEKSLTYLPNETFPKQKIAKINEIKTLLAKTEKQTGSQTQKVTSPKQEIKIADLKFNTTSEREEYLKELMAQYPPGITCEVYKEKNRVVTRYIIIRENEANDYREIKYNWGGIDYLKNDRPVTLLFFNTQIKAREGEYFTKSDM